VDTQDPKNTHSTANGATPQGPGSTPDGRPDTEPLPTECSIPLLTIDCVAVDVPPGTPAVPRPAGRERRMLPDTDPAGPDASS
jgi:hypothetical protein